MHVMEFSASVENFGLARLGYCQIILRVREIASTKSRKEVAMQGSLEYLTLALDVRRLTDSLVRIVEGGTRPEDLNANIRKVVISLQGTGKTSIKSLRERGRFGRYAGVRAIKEVFGQTERQEFAEKLEKLIKTRSVEQRRESALDAIPYFDALERRALYHHRRLQTARRPVTAR